MTIVSTMKRICPRVHTPNFPHPSPNGVVRLDYDDVKLRRSKIRHSGEPPGGVVRSGGDGKATGSELLPSSLLLSPSHTTTTRRRQGGRGVVTRLSLKDWFRIQIREIACHRLIYLSMLEYFSCSRWSVCTGCHLTNQPALSSESSNHLSCASLDLVHSDI